jgi:hypothetical protein
MAAKTKVSKAFKAKNKAIVKAIKVTSSTDQEAIFQRHQLFLKDQRKTIIRRMILTEINE